MKDNVIAIDGPSGSGKSTIARKVANKLDLLYLNTGAMFRALGIVLKERGYSLTPDESLSRELNSLNFEYGVSSSILVRIDHQDLTKEIKKHEVSSLASKVSQNIDVRDYLKNLQRELAITRPSILDGRDIGTVIFPEAKLKIFLTASPEIRAERRLKELKELDHEISFDDILQDIENRDQSDKSREIAPLKQATDAVVIDTSNLSIDKVVEKIVNLYKERL